MPTKQKQDAGKPSAGKDTACTGAYRMLEDFFIRFTVEEACTDLEKMTRAAFARKELLDKEGVLDILYLKEQLLELLDAAHLLAKNKMHALQLERFFRFRRPHQWAEAVNELFYAAAYDGFFTTEPTDDDIYQVCRGLHKLIKVCHTISTQKAPPGGGAG